MSHRPGESDDSGLGRESVPGTRDDSSVFELQVEPLHTEELLAITRSDLGEAPRESANLREHLRSTISTLTGTLGPLTPLDTLPGAIPTPALTDGPPGTDDDTIAQTDPPLSGWPAVTERLSDVTLQGVLGAGGMGLVHLGHQASLGRDVAVKLLRPELRSTAARDMILREARLAGGLEHPNLVPIHALADSEASPAIVMKRVEGAPWSELIADSEHALWAGYDADRVGRHVEILMDVCHAVHFAHSRGVLHRDIKPANVMVGRYGEVYLVDWGVAITADELAEQPTDRLVGTPSFMAPEMVDPARHPDDRADVFLLGATLHAALTGRVRHEADDAVDTLMAAHRAEPFDYSAVRPEVPDALAAICNQACAREPEERFPSAAALREALAAWMSHRGSEAATTAAEEALHHLRHAVREARSAPSSDAHLQVNRLYSACRFGFEQALREWPENTRAQRGRKQVIEWMLDHELSARNPAAAAVLLDELAEPDPTLKARLETLEQEAAQTEAAGKHLDQIRQDLRLAGRDWGRSALAIINGFIIATVASTVSWMVRNSGVSPTPDGQLIFMVIATIGVISGVFTFQRYILDNRVYRRLMLAYCAWTVMLLFSRILGLIIPFGFHQTLVIDGLITTAWAVVLAATVTRAFWVGSLLGVIATCMAALTPDYAADWLGWTFFVNNLYIGWEFRPGNNIGDPLLGA